MCQWSPLFPLLHKHCKVLRGRKDIYSFRSLKHRLLTEEEVRLKTIAHVSLSLSSLAGQQRAGHCHLCGDSRTVGPVSRSGHKLHLSTCSCFHLPPPKVGSGHWPDIAYHALHTSALWMVLVVAFTKYVLCMINLAKVTKRCQKLPNVANIFHCVFSNVSSNGLPEKTHSRIRCICLTLLHCAFSNVSSKNLDQCMQNYTGCIFSPSCVFRWILKWPVWVDA